MKVKELKEFLKDYPDDTDILLFTSKKVFEPVFNMERGSLGLIVNLTIGEEIPLKDPFSV